MRGDIRAVGLVDLCAAAEQTPAYNYVICRVNIQRTIAATCKRAVVDDDFAAFPYLDIFQTGIAEPHVTDNDVGITIYVDSKHGIAAAADQCNTRDSGPLNRQW